MVKINGVNGFAFIREILWCELSKKALYSLEVHLIDSWKAHPLVIVDADDCLSYEPQKSKARRIYATPHDHEHAALMLQAA